MSSIENATRSTLEVGGATAAAPPSSLEATAPVLLSVRGLRKAFGGQVVLDGVDLELRQGEVVLLRGENGSGKTTLLNILTGNLEPDSGTIEYRADDSPRSYTFPRRWWQELNPFDHFTPEFVALEGMGRTWQDVRLFGAQSLRDNIAVARPAQPGENPLAALLAPRRTARSEAELARQADASLAQLGLEGRETSSADMISLGQSKRVAIARSVAAGARVLFLDEPLAALDEQGVEQVTRLLTALAREHQATLVVVEHVFNQERLRALVTTDWLLEGGKLVRTDRCSAREAPSQRSQQQSSLPHLIAAGVTVASEAPLYFGGRMTRLLLPSHSTMEERTAVLEIRDLVVERGRRVVVGADGSGRPPGLDLTIFEGEIVVIEAPNGWGKTTLLAAISGLCTPSRGTIALDGQCLNPLAPWERSRRGLRVLPSSDRGFPSLTLDEVSRLSGMPYSRTGLHLPASRKLSTLSGGENRALLLELLGLGRLALLDEPFFGLDLATVQRLAPHLTSARFAAVLITLPHRTP